MVFLQRIRQRQHVNHGDGIKWKGGESTLLFGKTHDCIHSSPLTLAIPAAAGSTTKCS